MPTALTDRRRDPAATRATILDAAEELFIAKGFADTSVSQVARLARVTKSLIHHHFGSKEELWTEVKRRAFQEYFDVQHDMLGREGDSGAILGESLITYFDFLAKNPKTSRLLSWVYLEEDEDCDDLVEDLLRLGIEKITEGQARGLIRQDVAPASILVSFLALVEHWFLTKGRSCRTFLDGRGGEAELEAAYREDVIKIFLKGVLPG